MLCLLDVVSGGFETGCFGRAGAERLDQQQRIRYYSGSIVLLGACGDKDVPLGMPRNNVLALSQSDLGVSAITVVVLKCTRFLCLFFWGGGALIDDFMLLLRVFFFLVAIKRQDFFFIGCLQSLCTKSGPNEFNLYSLLELPNY